MARGSACVLAAGSILASALLAAGCGTHPPHAGRTANEVAAQRLGSFKLRVDNVDGRLIAVQPPKSLTQKALDDYATRLDPIIADYGRLIESATVERSRLSPYSDADVHRAWNLLIRRSKLVVSNFRAMTSALRKDDLAALDSQLSTAEAQRKRIDPQIDALINKIADRYGT